tara:strand:+ start:1613 stop:2311 length:699 start_codon:yes stop_codon:yes gene_type:complete
MEVNSFIPKPVKTGSEFFDTVLGFAQSFTPGQAELGLYNSAKDVYNDYKEGDYKSLGRKALTEVALNALPYGVGKVAKPVVKSIKRSMKNISPNQILDGIGPRALKNDGTIKRGVNEAGYNDFKKTGLVREKQGGTINFAERSDGSLSGFNTGKDFSKNSSVYASPRIDVAKQSRYYGPGGAIYGIKNPNIKFKKQYVQDDWSMVTKDKITATDVDIYENIPILGFRKVKKF